MKKGLAFLLLLGMTGPAHAVEAVLKSVTGTVRVRSHGHKKFHQAQAGESLRRDDRVALGPKSSAQVVFTSGATMLIKEKSRFTLKHDKHGTLVSFDLGEFLIGLKTKLTGGERFRVRTPAAIAAVRGTVFWGKTDEAKTSQYACFTGNIEIWAKGKMVTIKPGESSSIAFNQAPGAPSASTIPADYIQTFAIDGSLQGLDQQITEESSH